MVAQLQPALQQGQGRSLPWSGASLVNAFAERSEGDKVAQFAVMALPGLVLFKDAAAPPVRGLHRMVNAAYAVIGSTLYGVASNGDLTSYGTIGGTGPVRMADNGTQLAVQGGPLNQTGYVLSAGVLTTQPTNLPPVSDVTYIDGYFVWTVANSDQFVISGLNDGLTYDPLDVATVEGDPDYLVGVVNSHRELLFPGTLTTEVWYNSGDADFPFARQGNAFIERGCIDRNSLVKLDNSVFSVGDDRVAYRVDGYTPTRISTHAIEYHLALASWFRGFTYSQEGHKFYVLNTDVGTFAYDVATGAWAERKSFGRVNYRVGCSVTVYGQTILGDAYAGKLYTPSLDEYTEDGDPIQIEIGLPTIQDKQRRLTLYSFETLLETGVGNADAPDPQIVLVYSRNGGRSWSNEMWRSLGAVGDYLTRAVWRVNVEFIQLSLKLMISDPVRRFVISYTADVR